MPVHEYRCKTCGKVHDHLVGVTAEQAALVCPECGSAELSRLLSAFAINLKGSAPFAADCGSCESAPRSGGCCGGGACCHG